MELHLSLAGRLDQRQPQPRGLLSPELSYIVLALWATGHVVQRQPQVETWLGCIDLPLKAIRHNWASGKRTAQAMKTQTAQASQTPCCWERKLFQWRRRNFARRFFCLVSCFAYRFLPFLRCRARFSPSFLRNRRLIPPSYRGARVRLKVSCSKLSGTVTFRPDCPASRYNKNRLVVAHWLQRLQANATGSPLQFSS